MNESSFLRRLKRENNILEERIATASRDNKLKKSYEDILNERYIIKGKIVQTKDAVSRLRDISISTAKRYRQTRLGILTKEIERNLELLLPEENFKVKIDFRSIKDRYYADLYVSKSGGEWFLPKAQNGKFIQQIISFSAMYSVNKMRGCKVIFSDESLSSADKKSLTEIKPLLEELLSEGFQLVIIEHKEEMYKGICRKENLLIKDRELGSISEHQVKVYEGGE